MVDYGHRYCLSFQLSCKSHKQHLKRDCLEAEILTLVLLLIHDKTNVLPSNMHCSQHFIFLWDEWAQKARVLHYIRLERPAWEIYSCEFGPFIIYEENKVL
jgi:hypothetical protein